MPRPKSSTKKNPRKRTYNGPFTIPALTRIARKAGIKSITPSACAFLRTKTQELVTKTVEQSKLHQEHISGTRKTLMREDIDIVLYERGVIMANSHQKKLAKHKFKTFDRYITAIIKKEDEKTQISKDAQSQLNSFIYELAHKLVHCARKVAHQNDKVTITLKHIKFAIQLTLGTKLGKGALEKASQSITHYKKSLETKKKGEKGVKMTERTKLIIPPSRMTQFFKSSKRNSLLAKIALTAGVEHVVQTLLKLAKDAADLKHKTRIFPKYLKSSVAGDEELKVLVSQKLKFKFVRVPTANEQIQDTKRDNATRQIKKQQRSEDNAMRRMPFERLVKSIVGKELRVSADAVDELMDYVESSLYDILCLSKNLAKHAKRTRVGPQDVELAFATLKC